MPRSRKLDPHQLSVQLRQLTQDYNNKQPGVHRQRLLEFFERHPHLWNDIGTYGQCLERAYLDLLEGPGQLPRLQIDHEQAQLRRDLLGDHPTPTEQVLVDLVCVNRAAAYCALRMAAEPGASMAVALQRSRRAEIEQRRLLQSVRTLTTLRALLPRGLTPADSIKLYQPPKRKKA